jgi:hypothetical protein
MPALVADPVAPASPEPASPRRARPLGLLLVVLLLLPLVVVAVSLRTPTWFPTLDLAMTELRVRDVGTSETPLIGLPGRIGTLERQGSHPGPLSFYGLTPTYRLLGSSAWSLQVGAIVLTGLAMATCVVLAARRGGPRLVAGVALLVVTLALGYGFPVLTEPWNPYLPLFWWVAYLLACWGLAERDLWLLPVAVAIGSYCAQTHLPYLGMVIGTGIGSIGLAIWADRRADGLREVVRPALVAVGVGLVLWSPVVVDQLTVDPGNATLLAEHLTDPPEEPVGLGTGARVVLVHLDLSEMTGLASGGNGSLVDTSYDPDGTVVPGIVLLLAWAASALAAWRAGLVRLVRLDLVLAGATVLAVVSASNIFGKVWYYLTLWAWALPALMVLAIVATVAGIVEPRLAEESRTRVRQGSLALLVGLVAAGSLALAVQATSADEPAPRLSKGLAMVVDPTAAALEAGDGSATGADGRYVVTWTDALYIGSQAYGLVSELERAGLDVGVRDWAGTPVTEHRVIPPDEVTAVVHFASGSFIDRWRAKPDVVEVVHVDPRTEAEEEEYAALEAEAIADLEAAGLDDLVPLLDGNLFGASLDPRVSDDLRDDMGRLLDLGLPISVFIAPPDVSPL